MDPADRPVVLALHVAPTPRLPMQPRRQVEAEAAPCQLLDDVIGDGARTALRRRAGTVFRLLTSGTIRIGDVVDLDPGRWETDPTSSDR